MSIVKRALENAAFRSMFFWETPHMAKAKAPVKKPPSRSENDLPPETTKETPAPADGSIWPVPLALIGGTGEYMSGKSLFGLSIDPGPRTICFDFEKSCEPYQAIGMTYVDVPTVMAARHPRGYQPIDIFKWWRDAVLAIPAGKYTVIHLDTASEIEEGLVEYVRANPTEFGYTAQQFGGKSDGLFWAAVKSYWKRLLTQFSSKVQTIYFTVHLKQKWVGGTPTRERIPKGKSTLMELSSLFLFFERVPVKGIIAPAPSAIVVKHRLTKIAPGRNGVMEIVPLMPPRIPIATPAEVRRYMLNPPNPSKLSPEELLQEEKISDADLAEMKLLTAQAEESAEKMKLDRLDRFSQSAINKAKKAEAAAAEGVDNETEVEALEERKAEIVKAESAPTRKAAHPSVNHAEPVGSAAPAEEAIDELDTQLARNGKMLRLKELYLLLDIGDEQWEEILSKRGVTVVDDLDDDQVVELTQRLEAVSARRREKSPATNLSQ